MTFNAQIKLECEMSKIVMTNGYRLLWVKFAIYKYVFQYSIKECDMHVNDILCTLFDSQFPKPKRKEVQQ